MYGAHAYVIDWVAREMALADSHAGQLRSRLSRSESNNVRQREYYPQHIVTHQGVFHVFVFSSVAWKKNKRHRCGGGDVIEDEKKMVERNWNELCLGRNFSQRALHVTVQSASR